MSEIKNTIFKNYTEPSSYDYLSQKDTPLEVVQDDRDELTAEALKKAIKNHLLYEQGTTPQKALKFDFYMALALTIKDRLMNRWIQTREAHFKSNAKLVCYLSAEFLTGKQLHKNILNIGCWKQVKEALKDFNLTTEELLEQESEPALGNGGLGRLAACFMDSLSTLDIPAIGYGIRYEYGIFEQDIQNGYQVEKADKWLRWGNPWELERPKHTVEVKFGGYTEEVTDHKGKKKKIWIPATSVLGTPYDTLVPGFQTENVNTLRLWSARTTKDFDFSVFNQGDYFKAVQEKTLSENISKVLYPNDSLAQGKELRLKQQYFFVSCSLQDIIRIYSKKDNGLNKLYEYIAIQLNDTHPAIAVAELMRILVDEYDFEWNVAWNITVKTCGYTNHTLLVEALEKWSVDMFKKLLPRHLEIIYDINFFFIQDLQKRFPYDGDKIARMSLIEEGENKQIRMAHLATVGSHAINGVAKLHSELIKKELLHDFYEIWPERFQNKTNGVTPRRWLMLSNHRLSLLITEKIGKGWVKDLNKLKDLENFVNDSDFINKWRDIKLNNKRDLTQFIYHTNGVEVSSNSIFDVQVKRIHEYKRQLLNVLHIITLYNRLKRDPNSHIYPRTFIFGGKAAPGYYMAKLVIKLINSVADIVNNDRSINNKIKVIFLKNFSVSMGEKVYPAADISEQISTAGKEASGTGNMKFALNGALTVGTLDGANIEIREAVGEENFFLFGLNVHEINSLKNSGYYPYNYYNGNSELKETIDKIASGYFSGGDTNVFKPIVDSLLNEDRYFLLADFASYVKTQEYVQKVYKDSDAWTKMSILNVARMGYFSSDRAIKEYCEEIWNAKSYKEY